MRFLLLIAFLNIVVEDSQARVFNLLNETIAPYFKGTVGNSKILQNAFDKTSGNNLTIDQKANLNQSGEFGLLMKGPNFGFRLGIEIITPSIIQGTKGLDANQNEIYDFESRIQAIVPKVGFDFGLYGVDLTRVYLGISAGIASAQLKNSYNFTTAGQSAFPGIADYADESTGTSTMYEATLGYEHLLSDTTTFCFELGYRNLKVDQLKYKSAFTDIYGVAHSTNEVVLNSDGLGKTLDFSGPFVGLALRFYLGK